jgi:hypothetical protein
MRTRVEGRIAWSRAVGVGTVPAVARGQRARLVLVALAAAWLGTGCQVTLAAGVTVGRDGKGTVTAGVGLDAEALQQVGDLAAVLRVDDLRQAGWSVSGPRKESDGLTWMRASKPFADAAEATAALAQLSGPDGPFRDLRLTRTRGFLRTTTSFTGAIDLGNGLAGLSDPDLGAKLSDVDLGLDLDGLKKRFGPDLARAVRFEVAADLPGKLSTNAPRRAGGLAQWAAEPGKVVDLRAEGRALNLLLLLPIGVAVLVAVAVVTALAARRRRARG